MERDVLVVGALVCFLVALICACITSWTLVNVVNEIKQRVEKLEKQTAAGCAFFG